MAALNFLKKSARLSPAGSEILAFSSHWSVDLDCFIPNFKLKYEDSENIKADRVNTVVFNLHQSKQMNFLGAPCLFTDLLRKNDIVGI